MKVYELIWRLLRCNPTDLVVIAKPGTGEGSPVDSVEKEVYDAEETWWGNLGMRKITKEDRAMGYTEEDVGQGEDCVVLWPIH